jgi:hypothetical protein
MELDDALEVTKNNLDGQELWRSKLSSYEDRFCQFRVEKTQICYQSVDLVIVHANSDTFLKTNFYYMFRISWCMKLFYEISVSLRVENT